MSKMKDAFQNLLSKAKPQQNQQGQSQQGKDQKSGQSKSQQGSKQNGKDGQQQNGQQQGDAQEGEDGQEAKNSENAQQGKGQGKSDSQQSSKQPGSGIGSQDGDKAIRNAEQLAAMGKITEILGKRAATISGEATVEVQTTNQQLHTPYAQKGAQHTQTGSGNQPRRSPGGVAALRAAILRAGSQTVGPGSSGHGSGAGSEEVDRSLARSQP